MKLWSGAPCRGCYRPHMAPLRGSPLRGSIGFATGWIVAFVIAIAPAQAQRRPKTPPAATKPAASPATEASTSDAAAGGPAKVAPDKPDKPDKNAKTKVFDFTGIDLSGRLHTPQLLYFLERANEELERAFLERRSFIPHMVRSLEEEAL